jgi:hypothetical protein
MRPVAKFKKFNLRDYFGVKLRYWFGSECLYALSVIFTSWILGFFNFII